MVLNCVCIIYFFYTFSGSQIFLKFSANRILPQSRHQNGCRTCVYACAHLHTHVVCVSLLINGHTINIGLQILDLKSYSISTIPVLVVVGRENGIDDLKWMGTAERTGILMRCGLTL